MYMSDLLHLRCLVDPAYGKLQTALGCFVVRETLTRYIRMNLLNDAAKNENQGENGADNGDHHDHDSSGRKRKGGDDDDDDRDDSERDAKRSRSRAHKTRQSTKGKGRSGGGMNNVRMSKPNHIRMAELIGSSRT